MPKEHLYISVTPDTLELLNKLSSGNSEFIAEAIDLGIRVQKGEIFQWVSGDFMKLSIGDINPLRGQSVGANYIGVDINNDFFYQMNHGKMSFPEWLNRVIALRMRANELGLSEFNGEGYQPMVYTLK